MISVNSTVKLNFPKIQQLTRAQVMALEQTAEALHTNVVHSQVFPSVQKSIAVKILLFHVLANIDS